MRSVVTALAVGLTLTGVAVAAVLARSPLVVAGTNGVPVKIDGSLKKGDIETCQPLVGLPSGTSTIRVAIEAPAAGPKVTLRAFAGSRVLAEGQQPAGWGSAPKVDVPVGGLTDAVGGERICTKIGPIAEHIQIRGTPIRKPAAGAKLSFADMALRMEYLRPGARSWMSLASSVTYHMGLGRAWGGTWIAFLALALTLAVAALAVRLTLKEMR
jgi:hypothetical protein